MNFKQLVLMNLQALTNFPYIEKDFDAVTDYQLLCLVVDHLNEVIKNSNEQNTVIQNLYNAFVALKDYVDNYFDNLDIQEEIDNKLDEMAASGELSDIIAQYLKVASVLAYDTKASLKSADNLVNGSITRTLGESSYNDGKGSYYKIRTVTSGDVIDDNNILALANFPTLIAEKIADYRMNQAESNINELIDKVDNLEDISKGYNGIMCISRSILNNDHYLYWSNDGIHFYQVGEKINNITSDSSALFKIKNKYYYLGNNIYQYSNDLKNWSEPIKIIEDDNNRRIWGSSLYYDEPNDIIYIYSSVQYGDYNTTFTNAVGFNAYYFKIVYQTATINEDGTFNINQTLNDLLFINNNSYIDPYVIKHDSLGYILACKNENTCQILLYSMTSPSSLNELIRTLAPVGIEAPQLIIDGSNNIILYSHDYAMSVDYITGNLGMETQTYNVTQISYNNNLMSDEKMGLTPCYMPYVFRHAGMCICDTNDYQLLFKQGIKTSLLVNNSRYEIGQNGIHIVGINTGSHNIINYPNVLYWCGGGFDTNIEFILHAYFKTEPLKICLASTKIKWNGDVPIFVKNKYLEWDNSTMDNEQRIIQVSSDDLRFGFLAPWNKTS